MNSRNPPALTAAYIRTRAIVSPTGCLEWRGAISGDGYGAIRRNHKQILVHRLMWELQRGAIPPRIFVLHKCDNPPCINVEHLFLGTAGDNARDMCAKGRHVGNRK